MSLPASPPTPRLVATDLDGTLVRSDGSVSAYTAEVLRALDDLDVPLVFVTGRPLRWTEEVFEHVGAHGLAVVSNGGLVWDVHRHRPWRERAFEREAVLAVARDHPGARSRGVVRGGDRRRHGVGDDVPGALPRP